MKTAKMLGIWMDNANAHIMALTSSDMETNLVTSSFTNEERKETQDASGEHTMHNKEQQQQSVYYKKLGDIILGYDDVILFGPTNAKAELFNELKEDHHFKNIKIEIQSTDKMTEHQEHAFVKAYFKNKL
jgi:stalled ribosome rescue protein Dom34